MIRLIPLISAVGLLIGCATGPNEIRQPPPHADQRERSKHSFSVGMTHEQLRADLTDSWLLISASRPPAGWSRQVSPPAGERAARFEQSHAGAVHSCDVYWIGHTNAPRMYYGKWL